MAERPEFADAIVRVLLDPAAARARADRAQQLVRHSYDWSAVGRPRRSMRWLVRVRRDGSRAGTLKALAVQAEMPIR